MKKFFAAFAAIVALAIPVTAISPASSAPAARGGYGDWPV